MSANLYEQTKEIAVLRAIGLTNTRIRLLYFYEAFLLVVASSFFGLAIGGLVAYQIIVMQVTVDSCYLLPYEFPGEQFGACFAGAIICAFVSTWGPTVALTRKPIASIFRS